MIMLINVDLPFKSSQNLTLNLRFRLHCLVLQGNCSDTVFIAMEHPYASKVDALLQVAHAMMRKKKCPRSSNPTVL